MGGYLDDFTYLRYRVFANAQTGNVVTVAMDLAQCQVVTAVRHGVPILAFCVGVALTELLATDRARAAVRRPFRVAVGVEILLLAVLALVPSTTPVPVVTTVVAFVATVQFTTFRTLVDTPYSTLMPTATCGR